MTTHHCPRCQQTLQDQTAPQRCAGCGLALRITPAFLSTLVGRIVFIGGAFLLGRAASHMLSDLGIPAASGGRYVIDIALGCAYYLGCNWLYVRINAPVQLMPDDYSDTQLG